MHWHTALCVLLVLLVSPPKALAADPSEKELKQIQSRIGKLERDLNKSTAARDKLQQRLAEAERLAAKLQANINQLNQEREESEKRLVKLGEQTDSALAQLAGRQDELASQVYSAYVGGRQEKIKLLLSQRDPAELGRVMVYYRYLNARRLVQISEVNEVISELDQLTAKTELEKQTVQRLQQQRHRELESLKAVRKQRQNAIAELEGKIENDENRVSRLRDEESKLKSLIAEIEQIMRDFPVGSRTSFAKLKGKLTWPVRGTLLADFGQSRGGGKIAWDGVLIGAERGAPVRAISRGRVAYADWLPGQGLLVVLEHGDNYFSLYGRNDTLNTNPGDWVEAGQTIATVGDSGGQARVALYFALRKSGKPISPRRWFKNRVSQ